MMDDGFESLLKIPFSVEHPVCLRAKASAFGVISFFTVCPRSVKDWTTFAVEYPLVNSSMTGRPELSRGTLFAINYED
jgi:hypothetical protein